MKLNRKLIDMHSITLEEVEEYFKRDWCFTVSDGKLITITIEK